LTATNYVYGVAKPDGLTLLLPNNSIYIEQLVGRKEVQFDLRKFQWIGSASQDSILFYMRADTPFKSVADIVKAKQPPSCGGSGTTSSDYIVAKILDLTLGAKINSVSGYPGGTEADLAVEKGEIVCRAHTLAGHFGREPFNSWHKKGFDRHLLQSGRKRDPRAPEAPTMYEVLEEFKVPNNSRRVAQALLSGGEFGRPLMVTPGTPPERVKILRESFAKVLKDELLAKPGKGRWTWNTPRARNWKRWSKKCWTSRGRSSSRRARYSAIERRKLWMRPRRSLGSWRKRNTIRSRRKLWRRPRPL
jgi:tripartite-type tricarboxylate transporter receptor subunit TctC